jgi:hypothetical protein
VGAAAEEVMTWTVDGQWTARIVGLLHGRNLRRARFIKIDENVDAVFIIAAKC